MDNGLNGAKWELRLPSKAAGLVRVIDSATQSPVLTWRPGASIHRPLWQAGTYTVTVGSKVFRDIKAAERKNA